MGRDVAPAAAGGCCGARAGQWSPSHPVSAPFLPMRPPLPPQNFLLLLQPSDRRRLHPKPPLPPQTRYPLQRMTVVVPRVAVKAELLMGVGMGGACGLRCVREESVSCKFRTWGVWSRSPWLCLSLRQGSPPFCHPAVKYRDEPGDPQGPQHLPDPGFSKRSTPPETGPWVLGLSPVRLL